MISSYWRSSFVANGVSSLLGKCGPLPSIISTTIPKACGITRMSENIIAASRRPSYLSIGSKVNAQAISGDRQQVKKSRPPLILWYSGRYRPAFPLRQRQPRNADLVLLTLTHHPYRRSIDILSCSGCQTNAETWPEEHLPAAALSIKSFLRVSKLWCAAIPINFKFSSLCWGMWCSANDISGYRKI